MKRIILAAALMLAACQTPGQPAPGPIVTPGRCAAALAGVNDAGRIIALLESFGLPSNVAATAAALLAISKTSVAVICAVFVPGKPLPAHPSELPPPPPGQ